MASPRGRLIVFLLIVAVIFFVWTSSAHSTRPTNSNDGSSTNETPHRPPRNSGPPPPSGPSFCTLRTADRITDSSTDREFILKHAECPMSHSIECGGRPVGRALVLYMMTTPTSEEYGSQVDWDNFNFFFRNGGVLPDGHETKLYEGVDYAFLRISENATSVRTCAKRGNVQLIQVPPGPCDLCAHSRVLEHLGVDGKSKVYRQVFFLNSGVRGPFIHTSSPRSHWVDVVTFAGRQRVSNRFSPAHNTVASVTTVSWESRPHPQSFFLSLPVSAVDTVGRELFGSTCSRGKQPCIDQGEMLVGDRLHETGHSFYSLSQGFTFRFKNESDMHEARHGISKEQSNIRNPTLHWLDPCKVFFSKMGGEVWRVQLIPRQVLRAVQRLSARMPRMRSRDVVEFKDLQMTECAWI